MRHRMISLCAIALSACASQATAPEALAPETTAAPAIPAPPEAGVATEATREANAALAARLPLDEQSDVEDAARGRIAYIDAPAILAEDGHVVWAIPQFDFLKGDAPDTVNPSLWRQSRLAAEHGLFEVGDGIWQVRGYDLSVMSVIEGKTGWIIVDPLTSTETASAALKLVNDTLGERPVTGLLYTHSHADHFGGARGVLSQEDAAERNVPILAPVGFLEHAVSENLIAGNQMSRRSTFMFGNTIPRSPTAHVGSGLGPGLPQGTISLIAPTEEISGRGTQRVIDGVTFEFIDAAGTEAPAEFMFYLPEKRALCTAEVVTATFHNLLTPRGAKVRDALGWSRAIDYVLETYGDKADVVFASHHWPTWGEENVDTLLEGQRDIYRYVHDQTLRAANAGATMTEAAEAVEEPAFESEADAFNTRGYYGTLNHNAKAVYQYYFGWWGGVPAEYYELPHVVTAARYVEAMGGLDATLAVGAKAFEAGDYRWAAEVFNHAVFAEPESETARNWLAATYEQLGFQAESGAWRSYFLVGASELRNGIPSLGNPQLGNPEFLRAVKSIDLMDSLAARYNPAKMTAEPFAVNLIFPDRDEAMTLHLGKSVLVPREGSVEDAAVTLTLNRSVFDLVLLGKTTLPEQLQSGAATVSGNPAMLQAFFGTLDRPDFWFPVVTP
ncbi:alkyl/aryl-sulfatase [Hyphomonas oceanitis]|uniref:alkyl/aryl-sulfatase n=1 Tax=Hyphomonas oceanitis TaxID=81033 RepID=UPI003003131E